MTDNTNSETIRARANNEPNNGLSQADANPDDHEANTIAIEAAVFRRLLSHLDANKQVQNIELMNLANFCRNCLAKWYTAEAEAVGRSVSYEQAREIVYGIPYPQWKQQYLKPATPEQLALFEQKQQSSKKPEAVQQE